MSINRPKPALMNTTFSKVILPDGNNNTGKATHSLWPGLREESSDTLMKTEMSHTKISQVISIILV